MKRVALIGLFALMFAAAGRADTTIDSANHYAWGANIGFTDWRPSTNDGVNIGTNFCRGFIYAANVGWISLGNGTPPNDFGYTNSSALDFGVNCASGAPGEKVLRGFAYGANIGWISFEETGNPRVILATGRLRGFVWSANIGWINLDDANIFVATTPQSPTPSPTPTATATASATATPNPSATVSATPGGTATPTAPPGGTASPTATPSGPPNSRLANISTRMRVEAGDNVLIAGFIIQGTENKRIIIRAIGPSLAGLGIADPLEDPTLALNADSGPVGANDNWMASANAAEIANSGLAPSNANESALLLSVAPGTYTAVLRGKGGATGVGLVEVYDLDANGQAKIVNISTRGYVLAGDNVMIGGLIVVGNSASQLVVRGIGPSLGEFGVPDPLTDPSLELRDGNGALMLVNNNWRETQEAALTSTGLAPTDDQESAMLINALPGNYTAILRGADDGTGNGLIEVYQLGP